MGERGAGGHVPGLQHGGMTGRLQLPGDPFRPGPVGLRVADEEVAPLVHLPAPPSLHVSVTAATLVLSHPDRRGMAWAVRCHRPRVVSSTDRPMARAPGR